MQERGRLQEGMVADIVIFDADNVTENATFQSGANGLPSTGIPYVLVNGTIIVKDSKVLRDVYPGQPLRFPIEAAGRYEPISAEAWKEANLIESKEGLETGTLDDR
jgi:N-acyl-D-aspartate/D-glutamate deacylase